MFEKDARCDFLTTATYGPMVGRVEECRGGEKLMMTRCVKVFIEK